jgi:hypothetical protein
MRSLLKALLVTGSLVAASLSAAVPATAAEVAPTLNTTNFACSSNGVCEAGPGNVGMSFGAGLVAVGQQCGTEGQTIPEVTGVIGNLPPGLQIGFVPTAATQISGTPTTAGTYSFTVQLNNVNYASGQICGPTGTQQLTITIGTGSSDRPANVAARYNGHLFHLTVSGYDANVSLLWSASVTAPRKVIFSNQPSGVISNNGAFAVVTGHIGAPCGNASCKLTVTNSLGFSATVTMPPPTY